MKEIVRIEKQLCLRYSYSAIGLKGTIVDRTYHPLIMIPFKVSSQSTTNLPRITFPCLTLILYYLNIVLSRMFWSHIRLPVSPTGLVGTHISTWQLVTWFEEVNCSARPASGIKWTTSSPRTSASCSLTWTNRRASESSRDHTLLKYIWISPSSYCPARNTNYSRQDQLVQLDWRGLNLGCIWLNLK